MANLKNFIPFILKWEGGYVNDPADLGGATNIGVTLKTWQDFGYDKNGDGVIDNEDLKQVFVQDVIECVLRPYYWDRWQANRIQNQSIANILVDWLWLSGETAITTTQRMLKLEPDGKVGEKTLAAINDYPDQQELFNRINAERVAYIERICKSRPANNRFKKGWFNRLNDIKFTLIILVCLTVTCFTSCKSVASSVSAQTKKETELHSGKTLEQRIKTLQDALVSKQSASSEDSETTVETITVRFDTALTDSITGKHPVKEMTKTLVTQGKAIRSAASEVRESHRDDSTFVYSKENVDRKTTESVRMQKVKVSTSSLWLYIILALIVLLAVAGWIVKRKIGRFFSG